MFKENPQSEFVNKSNFFLENKEILEPLFFFYDKKIRQENPQEIDEDSIVENICVHVVLHILNNSTDPDDLKSGNMAMPEFDEDFMDWIKMAIASFTLWKLERLDLIQPILTNNNDGVAYESTKILDALCSKILDNNQCLPNQP